jgi:hypothetical protein
VQGLGPRRNGDVRAREHTQRTCERVRARACAHNRAPVRLCSEHARTVSVFLGVQQRLLLRGGNYLDLHAPNSQRQSISSTWSPPAAPRARTNLKPSRSSRRRLAVHLDAGRELLQDIGLEGAIVFRVSSPATVGHEDLDHLGTPARHRGTARKEVTRPRQGKTTGQPSMMPCRLHERLRSQTS